MKKKLKTILPYIIVLAVVLFIKAFIVTPIKVNGKSMYPTLDEGDVMILNKTAYYFSEPERFDIVVISMPDEYLIKRIIGLPGEHIEYIDNTLYVNGEAIEEDFDHGETEDFDIETLGSDTVPLDSYLVLGDNRVNSLDSRELGFIKKDQLVGRTSFIFLPLDRTGGID